MTESEDLATVAQTIDRLMLWARRTAPSELSATSLSTLSTLAADGPIRISDLCRREGVSQPGMTGLVNRLVAAGWAEREADPSDGRAALVRITGEGERVRSRRRHERETAFEDALRALPAVHRQAIAAAAQALDALTTPPRVPLAGTSTAKKPLR